MKWGCEASSPEFSRAIRVTISDGLWRGVVGADQVVDLHELVDWHTSCNGVVRTTDEFPTQRYTAMQNHNRVRTAERILALMALAIAPAASAIAMRPEPAAVQDTQQKPYTTPPDQSQTDPSQPDQSKAKQKAVVVTGTIVKSGSDFVLKDTQGTVYQLDAQEKAAPFENQSVKVTGKLEQAANENQTAMLHVDAIEPMSA